MIFSGAVRNENSSTPKPIEQIFHDLLVSGVSEMVPENVEKLGAVAAAHRIFTNSLAAMPWIIGRKEGKERTEASHPVSAVLKDRANEYMTPFMAEKIVYSRAFWYGVGYAYIERGSKGEAVSLIPIPVEPEISLNEKDGTRWYTFTLPSDNPFGKEMSKSFMESQLFIFRFESYDGFTGRGFLDLARETADTDLKAQRYGNKFYTNGARPSGVIEVPAELGKEKRDLLRTDFERKYSGENAFKVAVLDLGMKYTQLGITQQESQYMEQRSFSVEEVSRYTGIPAYMLQAGKQSYQSNEQQQLDFVVNTLTPHLVQIEQEARYKLFLASDREAGFYLKKNEASLMRGTHEARANFYQKMIGISAMNADEVRALEDMSPVPDGMGQKFWMSKNYAPVDKDEAF